MDYICSRVVKGAQQHREILELLPIENYLDFGGGCNNTFDWGQEQEDTYYDKHKNVLYLEKS